MIPQMRENGREKKQNSVNDVVRAFFLNSVYFVHSVKKLSLVGLIDTFILHFGTKL